ncbi:EAL domain-containing protein [Vibrio sonorensis]|uniref:EAL domain-containing protein n=1 Tax=Vibrio sonorensis TaxID=1004316 RepID=UPI000A05A83E|nr:EAL domain-containing protein [Vibrio sonorensis]
MRFRNPHHGIVITDEQTRILACNTYYEKQFGFLRSELIGLRANIFNSNKHTSGYFKRMWRQIQSSGHWTGTILSRNASGDIIPQELTIQRLRLNGGRNYFLGLTVDLSDHPQRVDENELDGMELLTQLPTKDKFLKQLEESVKHYDEERCGVVLAIRPELDQTRRHSDKKQIALSLSTNRHCTHAGYLANGIFVANIEYFGANKAHYIRALQAKIRYFFREFRNSVSGSVYKMVIDGKIGISVFGLDADSPQKCVNHAVQAMLENHSGASSRFSFYHREIHQEIERRKELEEWLTHVVEDKLLTVHYQPIIDSQSWRIAKLEALCRFPLFKGEPVNTEEIIGVAEDLDLVSQVDKLVNEIALRELKKIHAILGYQVGITMNRSMNIKSGAEEVIRDAEALIQKSDISPGLITIEVTESAFFDCNETQSEGLESLRNLGASVAIDDFGVGYSSFSYLAASHFDILKIDRSFVSNLEKGNTSYYIVSTLTSLCHTLGVKVVAEGVETEGQVEILKGLGVDYMQGYYFSRPVPLENIHKTREFESKLLALWERVESSHQIDTLARLIGPASQHLDPGEPLRLAHEYLQDPRFDVLPVVVDRHCVGLVTRASLNLSLTPNMGTDLETSKEAQIWHRPVNSIMDTQFTSLSDDISLNELEWYLDRHPFPWVISDIRGEYRGLICYQDLVKYFISKRHSGKSEGSDG